MSVRVSRRLLEAALTGLNEAVDPNLDSADSYDKLVTALDSAKDGAEWSTKNIEGMGDGFIKQNGDWYVKTELTSELLAQILTAAGEEKLAKADKKNSLDLSLDATDFVGGVGKGVNFVREEPGGAWRDNTPISAKMLAAYKFKEQAGAVMPVTREGGLRAVKDDKFMFVLEQDSLEFYIMDVNNDPADPLKSMKNLFSNSGVNAKFGATDNNIAEARRISSVIKSDMPDNPQADNKAQKQARAEYSKRMRSFFDDFSNLADFVDRPSPVKFNTNLFKGGKIEDAMESARTIFGAFFDLFTPGTDLEMEFVFTKYGPAFKRRQQFLRKLVGLKTSLSNADFDKFAGTDYFEKVDLAEANCIYTFGDKKVEINSETNPDVYPAELKIQMFSKEGTKAQMGTGSDSYGWAYVLYLLGLLTRGDTEASGVAPAGPAPEPVEPPPDPLEAFLKEKEGQPVGDSNGAVFFNFNSSNVSDVSTNSKYIDSIATAIKDMATAVGGSIGADKKVKFTLVGCADPAGTKPFNQDLAERRNTSATDAISQKVSVIKEVSSEALVVVSITPGEDPWPADWAKITGSATGADKLRFAKLYWGDIGPEVAGGKALGFATAGLKETGALKESLQIEIAQIREHIRKIARSL